MSTPVSAIDAMLGKLTPYVLLGVGQAGLVWAISHWLFDLPIRGTLAPLGLATALLAVAHLVTGFTLSALARTQVQAIQAAVFFYLHSILLSGFMFPFTGMPRWAMWLGEALPLTHFIRAARAASCCARSTGTMWPPRSAPWRCSRCSSVCWQYSYTDGALNSGAQSTWPSGVTEC